MKQNQSKIQEAIKQYNQFVKETFSRLYELKCDRLEEKMLLQGVPKSKREEIIQYIKETDRKRIEAFTISFEDASLLTESAISNIIKWNKFPKLNWN